LGERIEAAENVIATAPGLDDDNVRRRRAAIGLDRGSHAAHPGLDVRLRHASILAGGLDGGGGLDGLAKGLHRHPRRRRDEVIAGGVNRCGVHRGGDHLPTSLIVPFTAARSMVAVLSPRWYLSSTVVRRPV